MTRLVSIALVYFADGRFGDIMRILEEEFRTRMDVGEHSDLGDASACIMDVRVSDSFALHTVQQRLEAEMPTVRIKVMERFRESWWGRYRWNIAIALGGGIAVALIVDLLRSSAVRLRDLLG